MAAYCQVYGVIEFTLPAGCLPVQYNTIQYKTCKAPCCRGFRGGCLHRDQLQAQRSVTSMGKLLPYLTATRVTTIPSLLLLSCIQQHVGDVVALRVHQHRHRRLNTEQLSLSSPCLFTRCDVCSVVTNVTHHNIASS